MCFKSIIMKARSSLSAKTYNCPMTKLIIDRVNLMGRRDGIQPWKQQSKLPGKLYPADQRGGSQPRQARKPG